MTDIILGNNFKIYYNTDTGNSSLQGINNVLIENLADFPTLTISSAANQFDTYDSDYLSTLLSEQTLEPLSLSIYYVPDNSTAMFLDEMAESQQEFQIVLVYEFDEDNARISGAIVNGYLSAYTTSGDKDSVVTRTYTFIHSDVVMRAMTVAASVPIYQGDYGVGSNTTDIAQYQPDVPTGNSFIKVPAAQAGNPTATDLMGIGLVDGTNVAEFAMTKSGTLSLFAKNANTAWTRIYTVTQMDSTYVPLTRTVNGKPLSGNVVLNASDLAGGTMTGALTVPALTVTGTTTLSGNTAAAAISATSLTSTGSTATGSLSVSGTTALAGVTTAGTINASTLNVSGNTVHTGTTKLNGVTTAGAVNAGATTATSLSVSGSTSLEDVTAGTVNAGATTATSLSVSGDTTHTGTTTLTGLTTAGTVNAEALTVSGNTTHGGTTTLTGTTTAGTVNAGTTTATSLSVSGSTSLADVTAGTMNASTVNASDLTLINALPVTQGGTGNTNGTVGQLTTARTFVTNLASTTAASFNGTANNSHGVTGILPISNGGTGNNTGNAPTATLAVSANVLSTARNITTDLGSTTAASFNGSANITPGVSGVLPIANGGTGNSTGNAPTATLAASATVLATARDITTDLGSNTAASFNGSANITPGITGILPVSNGGTGNSTGNAPTATLAASATTLATARNITTDLGSTTAASFNGSANITPGITGILSVANGGTGNSTGLAASATTLATARTITTNLASTSAASFNGSANVTPGVSGILSIANGGTGNATGLAATATALATSRSFTTDLSSTSSASFNGSADITPGVTGTLSIANGGTGATTTAAARTALGVAYGTTSGTVAQGNDSRLNTIDGKTGGTLSTGISFLSGDILLNNGNVVSAVNKASIPSVGTISNGGLLRSGYTGAYGLYYTDFYTQTVEGSYVQGIITIHGGSSVITSWFFNQNGNATANGTWISGSDERHKTNIELVPNALNAVLSWRGCTYDKKDGVSEVGLIAQDIEKDCAVAVFNSGKREFSDGTVIEDFKSLNVAGVSAAYHTEAIKELYTMIVELKNEISELKNNK